MFISDLFKGILIAGAVISITFFALFASHATTPDQVAAKQFLDGLAETTPFTGNEHSHMEDVKQVITFVRIFATFLIIGALWALSQRTSFSLVFAGTVLVVLPIVLFALPWNTLFAQFHHLFFPQGNWTFPATSHIIQTYPQTLFMWFAGIWAGLCILIGAGLIAGRKT